MIVLYSILVGLLIGILIPVFIGLINHVKHKINNPNEPDTASGAVSFLLIVTVPAFSFIGLIIGLFLL